MFHLEKLKDSSYAHEYAVTVLNQFEVLDVLDDPIQLWDAFKHKILESAKGCIGERPSSQSGFASADILNSISTEDIEVI